MHASSILILGLSHFEVCVYGCLLTKLGHWCVRMLVPIMSEHYIEVLRLLHLMCMCVLVIKFPVLSCFGHLFVHFDI